MFNSLTSLFKQLIEGSDLSQSNTLSPNMAIACLLCEVAGADHQIDEREQATKRSLIMKLLSLTEEETDTLLNQAQNRSSESTSLYDFTSQLRELSQETRYELIKSMWEVAYADGEIDHWKMPSFAKQRSCSTSTTATLSERNCSLSEAQSP